MKQAHLFLAAVALLGCGPAVAFTPAGSATYPPKPSACEVSVLQAPPTTPFQELGTIELQYKSQTEWITTEPAFKRRIQPLVCQAGGDAAIARINDNGLYMKATVLSLTPIKPSDAPAEKTSGSEPSEGEGAAETDPLADTKS
jgi:hypothetical protein